MPLPWAKEDKATGFEEPTAFFPIHYAPKHCDAVQCRSLDQRQNPKGGQSESAIERGLPQRTERTCARRLNDLRYRRVDGGGAFLDRDCFRRRELLPQLHLRASACTQLSHVSD